MRGCAPPGPRRGVPAFPRLTTHLGPIPVPTRRPEGLPRDPIKAARRARRAPRLRLRDWFLRLGAEWGENVCDKRRRWTKGRGGAGRAHPGSVLRAPGAAAERAGRVYIRRGFAAALGSPGRGRGRPRHGYLRPVLQLQEGGRGPSAVRSRGPEEGVSWPPAERLAGVGGGPGAEAGPPRSRQLSERGRGGRVLA